MRTIVLAVALGSALIVAPAPAPAGADTLGDLLGILGGGGSQQPEPPPPDGSPSPKPPPTSGPPSPQEDPIPPDSQLLAPESRCPGESDQGLPARERARAMVCLLSHARTAKHRSALHVYKPLVVSARHKARDIGRCHVMSHEACGRDAFYWIERVGFFRHPALAGEILAIGGREKGSALDSIRAWLGSPTHRAVILHPGFNLVGVGTVRARIRGSRVTVWVAHLGYHRRG